MGERKPELEIRDLLRENPQGLTITEIASRIGINRNSTAKYLKGLEADGQVESCQAGTAKCFYLSRRLPQSVLLGLASDLVCTFDGDHVLTFANDPFLDFFGLDREGVLYSNISELTGGKGGEAVLPEVFADLLDAGERVREITVSRDGEPVHLRVKTIPTHFGDGSRGTTILCEDVTSEWNYRNNLEFLARTSAELAGMGDGEDIYQYIGDRIAELEPGSQVGVASLHPDTESCTMRAFCGKTDFIEEFKDKFGDPRGITFSTANVPWAMQGLSRGTLIPGPESLYIMAYKMYPQEFCDEIQERLRLGKCYVMGCTCRGGLYGNIVIRLRKGKELRNPATVEAFVKQAGVALQRRYLREKQRRAEERIAELVPGSRVTRHGNGSQ
jgi:PAS domain S-box-containing protein